MQRYTTVRYRSWDDFKREVVPELFGESPFQRGRFIFRGQRSADWGLVPSFDRWFTAFPGADAEGVAQQMLDAFQQECANGEHAVAAEMLVDRTNLLALGQHYGMPTRLLDWSESPYVAAFFAFIDAITAAPRRGEVAVWALDTTDAVWTEHSEVQIVRVPPLGNLRLRNQAGLFTLSHTSEQSLEEYVERMQVPQVLTKFQMPVADARRAMADLESMGISPSRMYPELVGTAMFAVLRAVLGVESM